MLFIPDKGEFWVVSAVFVVGVFFEGGDIIMDEDV